MRTMKQFDLVHIDKEGNEFRTVTITTKDRKSAGLVAKFVLAKSKDNDLKRVAVRAN